MDRPSASQIFNSSNIVVTENGQKLSTVAQAKWAEATPVFIQEAMVDALEGSSRQFVGLVPTSGARTKTRIHLSVKNFEADFDQGLQSAPLAVVEYRVAYSKSDDRKLLGVTTVREDIARAGSINVSSIVDAIERANVDAMARYCDVAGDAKRPAPDLGFCVGNLTEPGFLPSYGGAQRPLMCKKAAQSPKSTRKPRCPSRRPSRPQRPRPIGGSRRNITAQ